MLRNNSVISRFLLYLKSNWLVILVCFLSAIVMWGLVLKDENPERVKTISNVQLVFQGEADLISRQLVVVGDRAEVLPHITVKVSTDLLKYSKLTEKDVTASVDLRKVNDVGTYTLNVTASSSNGSIIKISPETVTLNIDKFNTKKIPVEITTSNAMSSGMEAGEITTSKDTISIEGAYSIINNIVKACYDINLSDVKQSINESVSLTLIDSENNAVSTKQIYGEVPSVNLNMPVYNYKELEFDTESALVNEEHINQNYEVISVYTVPEKVKVLSSDKDMLKALKKIPLRGKIDLSDKTKSFKTNLKFLLDDDFWLDEELKNVEVHVMINEKQIEKTFEKVPIIISGESYNYNYSYITKNVNVTIKCGISIANKIQRENILLYASVKGLEPSNEQVYAPITYAFSSDIDKTKVVVTLSHDDMKLLITNKK